MDQKDQLGFILGCAIGFDMESAEIDLMLKKYGLTLEDNTLVECQEALRDHVGEERWKNGMKVIRVRTMESKSDLN